MNGQRLAGADTRRRHKSLAIALSLVALVVLFYAVTVIKVGDQRAVPGTPR